VVAPRLITRVAATVLAACAAAGCAGGPEELPAGERAQRERILAMRQAVFDTRLVKDPASAENAVARAAARLLALREQGEVRAALGEIDQHPGFVAQISAERENIASMGNQRNAARPQAYYIAVHTLLMRVEFDATYREIRSAALEPLTLARPLQLLGDEDWRVAVTAPQAMPAHYLATPAMAEWIRARAMEHIDGAKLDDAARARTIGGMDLLFPPAVTSDVGDFASKLLDEFLGGRTPLRTTKASWLVNAFSNPELPQFERLLLLRHMLRDGLAVEELLTVFEARAAGAGRVIRKLGLSKDRDVRAAVAMALPPGSEVIPAHAVLGSEGIALAALQPQLSDPAIAVRAAAALAWEGVPGINLGDYDPRAAADARAAALEDLADRIAVARAKAEAGDTTDQPQGAGSSADPLNPFAKPEQPAVAKPTREQRKLMRAALRAAGLLCDDFIRQLKRDPVSMMDVYEAYQRNHPWGGCHDAGDGRLMHEPSNYHLDVRRRPDGTGLTVWADPPKGSGGASYWWDNSTASIKFVRPK
jgi:hypothetical protein